MTDPGAPISTQARRARAGLPARRSGLALAAVTAFAGVTGLYRVFIGSATGQSIEHVALTGSERGRSRLWETAEPLLGTISLPLIGAILTIAVVIALIRRRWFDAALVFLIVGGSTATTQILKRMLERPDTGLPWTGPNSFPSGHTTMAAALTAGLLFITPERWRGAAAVVGVLFTTTVGASTLVGAWHRPSDVAAAILVVLGWYLLARAVQPIPADRAGSPGDADGTDGDKPVFRAGRAAVVTLLGVAIVAGAVAALTLFMTYQITADPSTGDYLIAYGGGLASVLAMASVVFAIMAIAVPRPD